MGFTIDGNLHDNFYSLSFDLNCKIEELLKLNISETMYFNNYIRITFFAPNDYMKGIFDGTINKWK